MVKTNKPRIVNMHHVRYGSEKHPEQELIVPVYKGEHEILSKRNLYTRKSVSKGFIKDMKMWIAENEDRAVDLSNGDIKLGGTD
jgi:hypothetical protein